MSAKSGTMRAAAGVIALIGWAGLAIQFSATFGQTGSTAETLWILLRYFTITTNLLVALVFTNIAMGRGAIGSPRLLAGITLTIMFVGIIYNVLLSGLYNLSGAALLANYLLHDTIPVLVPLFWLLFAPKGVLQGRDPFLWTLYPLGYLGYVLVRGSADNKYPYPFMDVAKIGWQQTAIHVLLILIAFLVAAFALIWVDRRLHRRVSRSA